MSIESLRPSLYDLVLFSFSDSSLPLPDLLFTVYFYCATHSSPKCPRFYELPRLCHTDSCWTSLNNVLFFTWSGLQADWQPTQELTQGVILYHSSLCELHPPLDYELCEGWNYSLFLVLPWTEHTSSPWKSSKYLWNEWVDGLMSYRNNCLWGKFNWRFIEMIWILLMAFLPPYYLK